MLDKSLSALVQYNDPVYQIENKEFNNSLLKFGSFVSIIMNKRLSQTFILLQLLENERLREIFKEICEIDNFQSLLLNFLNCYPNLAKSKIIKQKINQLFVTPTKKSNNKLKKNDSIRKAML